MTTVVRTIDGLHAQFAHHGDLPIMLEIQPGRFALLELADVVQVLPDPIAAGVFVEAPPSPSGLRFGADVLLLRLEPAQASLDFETRSDGTGGAEVLVPATTRDWAGPDDWTEHDRKWAMAPRCRKPWHDEGRDGLTKDTDVRVLLADGTLQTAPAGTINWGTSPDPGREVVKLERA